MIGADRYGRTTLGRKLGFGFLIVLVLIASLLVYAQTRHAFRHLLIPLAAHVTGVTLDARDGRLSLRGALEAESLVYEDPAAGMAVDAERVTLILTPWSLISGQHFIDDLEVKHVHLRVVLRPRPAETSVDKPGPTGRLPLLPVAVMRARFEDVAFTIEGDGRRITGRTAAEIDQLGPERVGTVKLRTDFALSRDGGTEEWSGAFDLALSVAAGSFGMPITWHGTNRVLLRSGGGTPLTDADPGVVRFDQTLEGDVTQTPPRARLTSSVVVQRKGTPLGSADVTAAMDMAVHPAVTDVALTVKGVTADTVNLLLGHAASPLYDGRFEAGMEARLEGTRSSIHATVTGSRVRLRTGVRDASPAMGLSLQHAGAFDSTTRDLSIETLTVTIAEHAKPILSGALDRPVSLRLLPAAVKTPPSGSPGTPAVWSLRLSPTRVSTLRPWFALFGPHASNEINEIVEGKLRGALAITVHEQGAMVQLAGRVDASDLKLRSEQQNRMIPNGPFGITAEWKARLTGLRSFRLDPLKATVSVKDKQVAALQATGAGLVAGERAVTSLDGTITFAGLPGEALNPLLALWSSVRIAGARINGQAGFAMDEQRARWKVDLHGQDIRFRLRDEAEDAPPLNWLSHLEGEFDRAARQIRVGRLNVHVAERRQPLVTLALDQPFIMRFAPGDTRQDASAVRGAPNTLSLRITRLSVHRLRPWMVQAGSGVQATVRGGTLGGHVAISFSDPDRMTLIGRLDLERLVLERASAPITVGTTIAASVIDRSRIIVERWETQAFDGARLLAVARLDGSTGSIGATDLRLNLTANDPAEFLARFGLLTHRGPGLLSGSRLTGDVRLAAADPLTPLSVKTELRSTMLSLDRTRRLTHSVSLQADVEVEVDAARTVADFRRIELREESDGAGTGTLTASGRWPMAAGQAGAITLTIKEWNCGPFIEFFGFLPGRAPGPVPMTAEITVARDLDAKTLAVQGKESIGPIRAEINGQPTEPATIHLQHDVVRSGEDIRVAALTFAAERIAGQNDHVSVSGSVRSGSQPRVQLRGAVDALDADWYAALATAPAPSQSSPGPEQTVHAGVPPVPLDLDVEVAIGTVTYRTVKIGQGRLVARGDGRRMQATLEPTGLADGTVQGSVTVLVRDDQPEFAWDLKGTALDLGALITAGFAGPEPRMTGRGTFTAAGTGRGPNETLRHTLNAIVFFDVTDGQFIKVPVLEFLANQTRIDQFRGLGFRTLHGALDVKNGWVTLQEFRAEGPVAGIEAAGKIAPDGRLDIRVEPKIGPSLSQHVRIPCLDQLAKTTEGFRVLPVAVTVKGTAEAPSYGVTVTPGNLLERQAGAVVGTIANLFSGCRAGDTPQRLTKDSLDTLKDTADTLVKELFGGGPKR